MRTKSRPCPSCPDNANLTSEHMEELINAKLNSGIDLATDDVYKKRLKVCSDCDSCIDDIVCMKCGCFVQLRALNKITKCPHPNGNKWA